MIKAIYEAGRKFAEKAFPAMAARLRPGEEHEDGRTFTSGAAALATGNIVKFSGYFGAGLTVLAALTNPVTAGALLAYGAAGASFAALAVFGKGMEKGGDNLTGLKTLNREIRHHMVTAVKEDFRQWRGRKLAARFGQEAQPEIEKEQQMAEPQPASVAKPARNAPQA